MLYNKNTVFDGRYEGCGVEETIVYLIRHGETDWNVERRLQGHRDVPLNPLGLRQAEKVARRLAKERLDAVYSSDLQRARITAQHIARYHRLEVAVHPGLRERNYGPFEGKRWDEIASFREGFRSHLLMGDGIESWQDMQRRVVRTLEEIVSRHLGQRLAVVTHGGTINAILAHIEGSPEPRYKIGNTSVTCIARHAGDWNIILLNDTSHWDGE